MMKNCEQTKGQSVLDHGISVKNYLFDLINHLRNGDPLKYEWVLPDWLYTNKDLILSSLPDDKTLELYTKYHDCGKSFCLTIDSDGKRHFPNHAEVSYQIFKQIFNNDVAAELIRRDMDIHLLKSDGVHEFGDVASLALGVICKRRRLGSAAKSRQVWDDYMKSFAQVGRDAGEVVTVSAKPMNQEEIGSAPTF